MSVDLETLLTNQPERPLTQRWFRNWINAFSPPEGVLRGRNAFSMMAERYRLGPHTERLDFDAVEVLLERTQGSNPDQPQYRTPPIYVKYCIEYLLDAGSVMTHGPIMRALASVEDDSELEFCINYVNEVGYHCHYIKNMRGITPQVWSELSPLLFDPIPREWKKAGVEAQLKHLDGLHDY